MTGHAELFRQAIEAAGLTPPNTIMDDGQRHRFTTNGRNSDGAGWYILHADGIPAGAFGDWRTGFTQSWCSRSAQSLTKAEREQHRARMAVIEAERDEAQAAAWLAQGERNRALWGACPRLRAGDLVHQYLQGRGIDLAALPGGPPACIRLHPSLAYYHEGALEGYYPAMVCAIVSPAGQCVCLHRTYLTAPGQGVKVGKAPVPNAKKMTMKSGALTGASIPLAGVDVSGAVGIAEGVETALACTLATGISTLAAISAGGLSRWQWPVDAGGEPGISELFIFADNDESGTGQKAAQELAGRALTAGIRTQTLTPTHTGTDWADVWAQRGAIDVTPNPLKATP
jgi:putative DNA primase/helicase